MENTPVELSPRAVKDLENLPGAAQMRIAVKVRSLASGAAPRGTAIKRLHGFAAPTFRLRIGDHRAVFVVEKQKIVVLRIIPRKELERALAAMDLRGKRK